METAPSSHMPPQPRERQMPPEPRARQAPPAPRRATAQPPPQPRERRAPPAPRERQPPPAPKHFWRSSYCGYIWGLPYWEYNRGGSWQTTLSPLWPPSITFNYSDHLVLAAPWRSNTYLQTLQLHWFKFYSCLSNSQWSL